jgi:hypothetical protein
MPAVHVSTHSQNIVEVIQVPVHGYDGREPQGADTAVRGAMAADYCAMRMLRRPCEPTAAETITAADRRGLSIMSIRLHHSRARIAVHVSTVMEEQHKMNVGQRHKGYSAMRKYWSMSDAAIT